MIGSLPRLDAGRYSVQELVMLLDRMAVEIERISKTSVSSAGEVINGPNGPMYRQVLRSGFAAKILSGTNPYAWQQQQFATGGTFTPLPDALSGTTTVNPAYEVTGINNLAAGTIVWLRPGFFNFTSAGQEYWFVGTLIGFTGTKHVCEGDGNTHTWTFKNGLLISAP
jgi:hypothetical protein